MMEIEILEKMFHWIPINNKTTHTHFWYENSLTTTLHSSRPHHKNEFFLFLLAPFINWWREYIFFYQSSFFSPITIFKTIMNIFLENIAIWVSTWRSNWCSVLKFVLDFDFIGSNSSGVSKMSSANGSFCCSGRASVVVRMQSHDSLQLSEYEHK